MSAHFSAMMLPLWMLFLLYKTCPVQTTEAVKQVVLIKPGTNLTLNCTFEETYSDALCIWFKQRLQQVPQQIGKVQKDKLGMLSHTFNNSSFIMEWINDRISLTILNPTEDDKGTYFCGLTDGKVVNFFSATFVSVREHPELNQTESDMTGIGVDQHKTSPTTPAADPQYQHVVLLVILCLALCVSVIWNLTVCSFSWTREGCSDTIKKGERPHDQNSENQMQKIWSQGDEFTHVRFCPV
ncbi:uncharacterized protein LOC143527577 isoform X2 [Brachyhypopomus gauderio]|uniref:uncharacterized protein LOC143527577 isoform X2 n=1 Tax=Brachyhypopomus gauderio TaxID=698409 RepID=UPI00404389B8